MRHSAPSLLLSLGLATTAFVLPACGSSDDNTGSGAASTDDFAEAIPGDEELALTLDDTPENTAQSALTPDDAVGQPSRIRALAHNVFERVNGLRHQAHTRIEALISDTDPTVTTKGPLTCKQWQVDQNNVHWQLTSCEKNKKNRHYAFALKGRPIDAGDDALVAVFEGEGRVMARFDGKKRGAGAVRFDFDALAELTGPSADLAPAGRVGMGFRAVGAVRQLNVALHDFAPAGDDTPINALYHYKHIVDVGGRIGFLAHGDIVARADDGTLMQGEDGQDELVRAVVAWNRGVGARAAAAICGGTAGEGTCERIVQCWKADGNGSAEAAPDADGHGNGHGGHLNFSAAECPAAPAGIGDISDVPAEDETTAPGDDSLPSEPAADPAEG